eukprot:13538627-Ditylum_brightwellii.AAC.1
MWRIPTWTKMKERTPIPMILIQPNSVGYLRWQEPNPRPKKRTKQLLDLACFTNNAPFTTPRRNFLLGKDIVIASALQIALMLTRLSVIKPTMTQDVSLTGRVALVSIQASMGLVRQLRLS